MDYVTIEYPQGINKKYVKLLSKYLFQRYHLRRTGYLLDVGAGTGDYTDAFIKLGIHSDMSTWDLEGDWPRGHYDYVFCKSVIEHIRDTQGFLLSVKGILKAKGLAIFLVPDWNSQWKSFYDDSTHVKPFTKRGLEQAFKLAGFRNIKCEYFFQLPFTWKHRWVPHMLWCVPYRYRMLCKLTRFSKERMLLLSAKK